MVQFVPPAYSGAGGRFPAILAMVAPTGVRTPWGRNQIDCNSILRREIPLEQHQGALLGFYDRSRGLDLHGVRRYTLTGQVYYVTPGQLAEVLFDAGVRTPSESFSFEGEIDFSKYRDTYEDALRQMIEAKIEGEDIVAPKIVATVSGRLGR